LGSGLYAIYTKNEDRSVSVLYCFRKIGREIGQGGLLGENKEYGRTEKKRKRMNE
jgi:hypothetical protein